MPVLVASGQQTLTNLGDAIVAGSAPSNPPTGQVWIDTSVTPNLIKKWNGTGWDTQGEVATSGTSTTVADLSADNKITRFERSIVRADIADITGNWMAAADTMPTLATIDGDTYNKGNLWSLRKSARTIGVNTAAGSNYALLGTAYTSLVTYLAGLSPKPWDVSSTSTITITAATWDQKWKDYYTYEALVNVEVQDRQKAYADSQAGNAQAGAIAAVQNAVAHATAPIANPMTIDAPVATIGLPEFNGFHTDSWQLNRNYVLGADATYSWTGVKGGSGNIPSLTADSADLIAAINTSRTFTLSVAYKLTGISYGTTSPWVGMQLATTYTDATVSYWTCGGGTTLGTGNSDFIVKAGTFTLTAGKTVQSVALVWGGRDLTGTVELKQPKVELGTKTAGQVVFTLSPKDTWGTKGNRIQPVTNPTFSTGTSLTMNVLLYGDGTNNDNVYWDNNGNLVKQRLWSDINLSAEQSWSLLTDYTGYKKVKATGFTPDVINGTAQAVKYDGTFLTSAATTTAGDQFYLANTDNALYVSIKDTDSGWGETYTPLAEEIGAYFLGWKMCNGTYGSNYTGAQTDVKTWFPIGDTDLQRAANATDGTPVKASPSVSNGSINYYQVVHRLATPVIQSGLTYNGLLSLIQGSNTVNISYPDYTIPAISSGTIKYATNLATMAQDLTYVIPSTMKRLADAETKVLDDAIITTVTNSVTYQTALTGKADSSDLSGLASADDLKDANDKLDGLNTAINGTDGTGKTDGILARLTTFATTTSVETTATGIKESFYQGGGMNLIKNSIGFAGLDFWENYSAYLVESMLSEDLDQLGFGSGFYFKADGQNKGIVQTITDLTVGQHFTLSWYLKKLTEGADSTYRFYIQIQELVGGVWTTMQQIEDNSAVSTTTFVANYMNYTATTDSIRIRFIGYGNVEAVLSGVMFTIGDVPIKWTLATGENYNTNIRMNINGIRVSRMNDQKKEIGYTMMSSDEFAGYYDSDTNGTFEKIFYLNGEETVSKKVRALNEITMGSVKITKIPASPDWLPNNAYAVNEMVANGKNTYRCTVAGTSGATGPTHTTGTATDGTVTWTFVSTSAYIGWAFVPVT